MGIEANNPAARRFVTLDVFRGMTIFLMIVVNTPGSGADPFPPLLHAEWNGCTLTDLVFPSFLFASGSSLYFSLRKQQQMQQQVVSAILRRALLIFVVGYLLTWYCTVHWNDNGALAFAPFDQTRVMAVLQRIAVCYCFAAIAAKYFSVKRLVWLAIILLLGYWVVLYLFGVTGAPFSETGNAVRKLDLFIIGEKHMYREHGVVFDPEGLLSTLPAIVNVLAGYITAEFITRKALIRIKIPGRLLVVAGLLIVLALLWNIFFPFNKKLWTSSYTLFATGIDIAVIALLYYGIDSRSWNLGTRFFSVFGKNPLFIYVLSNLFIIVFILHTSSGMNVFDWINSVLFQRVAAGPLGSLLFALSFTLLCWSFGWLLDRKKVYIRL